MTSRSRFYRETDIGMEQGRFCVLLDGRKVKTPAGATLLLPTRALALALAEEWRAQDGKIRAETMGLTRLANTAIDRVARHRADIVAAVATFGKSDLLCYRADTPETLRARQAERWNPLLDWARDAHGIALRTAAGIVFTAQPEDSLRALERSLAAREDFALAGLQTAAGETGSAILALALADERIDAEEAATLARLDEDFQAAIWGRDDEAEQKAAASRAALADIGRFFRLLKVR
jgi:chaperone required for assembly of F1-ATPase